MCEDCGCSIVREVAINGAPGSKIKSPLLRDNAEEHPHSHDHDHPHTHDHDHDHDHDHNHEHEHEHPHHSHSHTHEHRTLQLETAVLAHNDRLAERNRGFFQAKGLYVLNVLSSPGSGKTTFIQKTAEWLKGKLRMGVIVGDLATDNDAARLRTAGIPVVQITTGTMCHLEAEMIARAMTQLDLNQLDILVIENVGNLVCPAVYDLGETLRVVLLSTTEGEDKPLKYPPVFHSAQAAIISKTDLAQATGFDQSLALENVRRMSPHARIFQLSARTGLGMQEWGEFLMEQCQRSHQPTA